MAGALVGNFHRELDRIAFANESRRVRLHHQIFCRDRFPFEEARAQIAIVGKTHEAPLRERFRHRELQFYDTIFIRNQLRKEKGRFVQILPRYHLAQAGRFAGWLARRAFRLLPGIAFSHCHFIRQQQLRHLRLGRAHAVREASEEALASRVFPFVTAIIPHQVLRKFPVANFRVNRVTVPGASEPLKVFGGVLELRAGSGMIVSEHREPRLPIMRHEGVKRLVVKCCDHFGHGFMCIMAGNDCCPGFLLVGLELRCEMLPFNIEVLVAPGHVDVARIQIGAILADLRDMQRKATTHGFVDCLTDG